MSKPLILPKNIRNRLNYHLKRQLKKYGMPESWAVNTSAEAKILMLGITRFWDEYRPGQRRRRHR